MKQFLVMTLMLLTLNVAAQNKKPEWQDEKIVSYGKEQPRAYFMSYHHRNIAAQNDYTKSDYYLSLNGKWSFAYFEDYRKLPTDSHKPTFEYRGWDSISVPSTWERAGFQDAIYLNQNYHFNPNSPTPPKLPDAVPVGLYRAEVYIPIGWLDRDIYLHIGGASSGLYVYLNGKKIGYSEDSKSAAEFRLNDHITDGINLLTLELYRWSTGSYLEAHDSWRFSGIDRECYIYSQPKTRIEDFYVRPTLDSTFTDGHLGLDMCIINNFNAPSGPMQIWFELEDANGVMIDYSYAEVAMEPNSRDTVRFDRLLRNVNRWSAEDPYLYNLVLKIWRDGQFVEYASQRVGFRKSQVVGNQFLINGKAVKLKGVNYQAHHPERGSVIDQETIIEDMRLMKEHNINAIRLSGHPEGRRFYELADQYGFYICNEANIESAGIESNLRRGGTLGNNPNWLASHMDRVQNLYHQTKNYSSIVIWSLGNRAGNGYNLYHTYNWLKNIDPLRPILYQGAGAEWNTDILSPSDITPEQAERFGKATDGRPYIFASYSDVEGNSTGAAGELWEVIYNYPQLQGGFLQNWVSQALLEYDSEGESYWGYGGDYGSGLPSDGSSVGKGLVAPDRTLYPASAEIKKIYQGISFREIDLAKGRFMVENRYDFTNSEKFQIRYTLKSNRKSLNSGTLSLALKAGDRKEITIPLEKLKPTAGVEYFIDFAVSLKEDNGLLKKGFIVANEQFLLPISQGKEPYVGVGTINVESDSEVISVSSSRFALVIDRKTGFMSSYNVNGMEMMADELGLRPNFWRAPTDSDYRSGRVWQMKEWYEPSKNLRASSVEITENGTTQTTVEANYQLPERCKLTVTYRIYASGAVNVNWRFVNGSGLSLKIPRLGMRMRLPEEMERLEYFGRGAEENYSDRKRGTNIGHYKSNASIEHTDYVRPQESGHHTDVRWVALTRGERGAGIVVEADNLLEFNALSNSIEDFDSQESKNRYQEKNYGTPSKGDSQGEIPRQTHINDIKPRPFVELCLDYEMIGVGGDSTLRWIDGSKGMEWGFTLIPIRNIGEVEKVIGKSYRP